MKSRILIAFAFVSVLFSCSSDDSGSGSGEPTNFLPLETENFWKYNVTLDGTEAGQDHLYVGNDTLVGFKIMKTMAQPIGFFSTSLRHNALKIAGGKIKLTGKLGFNLGDALPIDIPMENFVIFNENASNNQELSSTDGTIEQTIGEYPLTINYILKSVNLETLASFTTPAPDSKTYTDVKKVKMVMNMEVSATFSGFPIPVMNSQDVIVSYQYYAKNIGMVYTNTVIDYELNDLPMELPFPASGTQNQYEFLDTYEVD